VLIVDFLIKSIPGKKNTGWYGSEYPLIYCLYLFVSGNFSLFLFLFYIIDLTELIRRFIYLISILLLN